MPLFSICIPNYNYSKYIGQSLQSVLDQSCQDFEIIVADNASTDDSLEVIASYAAKSEKIRIIQNRYNIGFGPNVQKATQAAQGDFLIVLSSDDLMLPGALEIYKSVIESIGDKARHAVFSTYSRVINDRGEFMEGVRHGILPWCKLNQAEGDFHGLNCRIGAGHDTLAIALSALANPLGFLSTLVSSDLYDAVEGYNTTFLMSPDYFFNLKILEKNPYLVDIDADCFAYRVHGENQLSQEKAQSALKFEFDRYQTLLYFNTERVAKLGVDHSVMVQEFVTAVCMKRAGRLLAAGQWVEAFRRYTIAWALYPGQTLRSPFTYLLTLLLLLGPVGGRIFTLGQSIFGNRSGRAGV